MTTFSNHWTGLVIARAIVGILLWADVCAAQDPEQPVSTRTDLIDIFPMRVGSRWVYDYTYHLAANSSGYYSSQWQRGTIAFTAKGVSEEDARIKWTILEEDDLHYVDTTGSVSMWPYGRQTHDSTIVRNFTFSLYEEADLLHTIRSDSCAIFWWSPAAYSGYGLTRPDSMALHRYTTAGDTVVQVWRGSGYPWAFQDSLVFLRDGGLVSYYRHSKSGLGQNTGDYNYWVTLRDYLAAVQPAGFEVPGGFALEQNYPNPFNPSTIIHYTVGGARSQGPGARETGHGAWELGDGVVRLIVYDLLGREVALLVDERKAPGSYEITFDGSRLSSGVYICRLMAGTFVQSKTMLLLK